MWAMDCFVRMMHNMVEARGLGVIRICADDVGGALKSIWTLIILEGIFGTAEK